MADVIYMDPNQGKWVRELPQEIDELGYTVGSNNSEMKIKEHRYG